MLKVRLQIQIKINLASVILAVAILISLFC